MKKRSFMIGLILMLALPSLVAAGNAGEKKDKRPRIFWQNYYSALATGKSESKPILLHFTADWCKWCKTMKRETYGNSQVARYLQENFATGWVDTEQHRTLAKKYKVNSLPTLWFLDSRGKSLTRIDGFLGPDKMMLVLEFIQTKAYETMTYEAWKEHHTGR